MITGNSMKGVMVFFDYMFYRFSKIYERWDGNYATTAIVGISLIQVLYLTEPLMYLYFRLVPHQVRQEYHGLGFAVIALIYLILINLNEKRFKKNKSHLEEKYSNESRSKRLWKLLAIIIVWLIPLIFPLLVLPRN